MRRGVVWACLLFVPLCGCFRAGPADAVAPGPAARPTDDPAGSPTRGRQIYTSGVSPSGRAITARVGDGPAVPAGVLACAQCHGADGRGRPEGGVTPPDVTWSTLTRPSGLTRPDGRTRPPYTPALLARALALGFDPGGDVLGPAMPRYQLGADDADDLLAYLRSLDDGPTETGVSPAAVRVGLAPGAAPAAARAVERAFEAVNRAGGVFGRRVELEPDSSGAVFAVVDVTLRSGRRAGDRGDAAVPVIAFQPDPADEAAGTTGARAFALVSGHAGQARALVELASRERIGFEGRFAVLHGETAPAVSLARVLSGRLREAGAPRVEARPLDADDPAVGCRAALVVGPADAGLVERAVTATVRADPGVLLLLPRALTGALLSRPRPDLVGRVLIAGPGLDESPDTAAKAVAALLVEALKATGRDLDRAGFVAAFERLSLPAVDLPGSPPLRFGPGRHTGARGAGVLRLGPEGRTLQTVVPWIDPEDPPPR